jgi:hypothetical protein
MDNLSPSLDSDNELTDQISAEWMNSLLDQSDRANALPKPLAIPIPTDRYLEHLIEDNRHLLDMSVLGRPPSEYSHLFDEPTPVSIPYTPNKADSSLIQSFASNDETQDQLIYNTYDSYSKNTTNGPKLSSKTKGIDTNYILTDNPLQSSHSKYTHVVRSDPSNVGIPLFFPDNSSRHLSSLSRLPQRPIHSDPILTRRSPFSFSDSNIPTSSQSLNRQAHNSDPMFTQQAPASLRHPGPSSIPSNTSNPYGNSDDEIWDEILPDSRVPQNSAALQPTFFLGSSGIIPSFQGIHQRAHQSDPILTSNPQVSIGNYGRHTLSSTPPSNDVHSFDSSGPAISTTPSSVSQKSTNFDKTYTPGSAQNEELSEYERQRLERIKDNKKFMDSLNILDLPVGKSRISQHDRKRRNERSQTTIQPRDFIPREAKIGKKDSGFYAEEDDLQIPRRRHKSATSNRPSSDQPPQPNIGPTYVSYVLDTSSIQPFQSTSRAQPQEDDDLSSRVAKMDINDSKLYTQNLPRPPRRKYKSRASIGSSHIQTPQPNMGPTYSSFMPPAPESDMRLQLRERLAMRLESTQKK